MGKEANKLLKVEYTRILMTTILPIGKINFFFLILIVKIDSASAILVL
jgi:hypothetical protein